MEGKIRTEEDYARIAASLKDLFGAEPGSEEAKKLKEMVQMVRQYAAERGRVFEAGSWSLAE